jgi:uncharacterized ParB-like nuclease family protein
MAQHPESVEYAKGLIKSGIIEEQIRKLLAISGMDPQEVEDIMAETKGLTPPTTAHIPQEAVTQSAPEITTEQNASAIPAQ